VPSREWLKLEDDVISGMAARTESALARRCRSCQKTNPLPRRHHDEIQAILEEVGQAKGTIAKRGTMVDYPNGQLVIRSNRVELACRTFDKFQQLDQIILVESKRRRYCLRSSLADPNRKRRTADGYHAVAISAMMVSSRSARPFCEPSGVRPAR